MVMAVTYTNFRKDLKSYLRRVNDDADMLLVTNRDPHDNVVVMSADGYDSLWRPCGLSESRRFVAEWPRCTPVCLPYRVWPGSEWRRVVPRTHG